MVEAHADRRDRQIQELLPSNPTVRLPIDALVLDKKNPRKGKVAQIAESLREFGQHRDAVVRPLPPDDSGKQKYEVIIGNHMVMAATMIGWTEIDCKIVNDDDIAAMRRKVADNRLGEIGGWDDDITREILNVAGTNIPGLDDKFVDKLFGDKGVKPVEEPVFPIVPKFSEQYSALVIFATSETDWAFLETVFGLDQRMKSYKNDGVQKARVVTAEAFRKVWESRSV